MSQPDTKVVRRSIIVEAPIERAFAVFTGRFGDFKPPEHNLLTVPIAETVFEPRIGGHIYDRGVDGSQCRWARILAYDPPERVVFSWDISPQWQLETDPDNASEVEVRFIAETPQRTASSSNTATSTDTDPVGKPSARASTAKLDGPSTYIATQFFSAKSRNVLPRACSMRLAGLGDPAGDQASADEVEERVDKRFSC